MRQGHSSIPRRRLAAIVFSDLVGYSALAQRDESKALQMLQAYRMCVRECLPRFGGREVKTIGDGFLIEFASALEAVQASVAMQESLQGHPDGRLAARIGIHLGDVEPDGDDLLGDGINIAARIEPLTPVGGVCVSEDVARQVQGKLQWPLQRLGRGDLKNIQLPVVVFRVVTEAHPRAQADLLKWQLRKKWGRLWTIAASVVLVVAGLGARLGMLQPVEQGDDPPPPPKVYPRNTIAIQKVDVPSEHLRNDMIDLEEGILVRLSRWSERSGLRIVDTQSWDGMDPLSWAARFNVGSLLRCEVNDRGGGVYTIVVTLLDVNDNSTPWVESYNWPLNETANWGLSFEIAAKVTDQIGVHVSPNSRMRPADWELSRIP